VWKVADTCIRISQVQLLSIALFMLDLTVHLVALSADMLCGLAVLAGAICEVT
jgi:hypothetical protein